MNKVKKEIEEILAKKEKLNHSYNKKQDIDIFKYLRNLINNYELRKLFIILIVGVLLLTLLFTSFTHGYFLLFAVIIGLGILFLLKSLKKSNAGYEKKWRGKSLESDDTDSFKVKLKNYFKK